MSNRQNDLDHYPQVVTQILIYHKTERYKKIGRFLIAIINKVDVVVLFFNTACAFQWIC